METPSSQQIRTHLQSGLPVVLLLQKTEKTGAGEVEVGHAVTVTGFSDPLSVVDVPAPYEGWAPLAMRTGSLHLVYVHDDNLGSHAHYELQDGTKGKHDEHDPLDVLRGCSDGSRPEVDWWTPDVWTIKAALVPKPRKLRMPVDDLFAVAWVLRDTFEAVWPGYSFSYEVRISTGTDYRTALLDSGLNAATMRTFQEQLSLPRYVGVATAFWKDRRVCDFLFDVTEVAPFPNRKMILAAVAPGVADGSLAWQRLDHFCISSGVPMICAPATP